MPNFFKAALPAGMLLLAACAEAPNQATLAYKTNAAESRDYVLTSAGRKMELLGETPVKVQANKTAANGGKGAKVDAVCTLKSTAFSAKVAAGQDIKLPTFGDKTPNMTVACVNEKSGEATAVVEPVNLTKRHYQNQAVGHALIGFGLVGMAVTAANAGGRDKNNDLIAYPPSVKVKF